MLRRVKALVSEAHRRHVWGVLAAYAAGAFVVAQVADIVLPALGAPPMAMTVLVLVLIAGVVPAFVLPWAYDLTPAGVKRTPTALSTGSPGSMDWRDQAGAPSTSFVGRDDELATLTQLLRQPETRLLSLVGPGGVGKSRLALQLAEQVEESFPDGITLAPLDAVHSRDGLATEIAVALGIPRIEVSDGFGQACGTLKSRAVLLILDGCEGVVDHREDIVGLLRCSPSSKLLITSRDPLSVREEHLFPLGGLSTSEAQPDAQTLFRNWARRRQPGFAPSAEEAEEIARICAATEGMPLAIELAAAWIGTLPLSAIREELESGDRILEARTSDYPNRQRSLGLVLDAAWRRLAPDVREVLTSLSVFEGSFSVDMARQVAGAAPEHVAMLADRSLMRPASEGDGGLRLSRMVRTYCRAKARGEAAQAARGRHARLFAKRLLDESDGLGTGRSAEVCELLQGSLGDILVAFRWYVSGVDTGAVKELIHPIRRFLDLSGRFEDGRSLFAEAAEALGDPDALPDGPAGDRDSVRAQLLSAQGFFAGRLGEFAEGVRALESAIETLVKGRAGRDLAFALNSMGDLLAHLGRYEEAWAFCAKAYELFGTARDDAGVAATANNLGVVAHRQGHQSKAVEYYQASLEACQRLDDVYGVAVAQNNLGVLIHEQGDLSTARAHYEEALAVARQVSDRNGEASALANLARVAYAAGDIEEMGAQASRAEELFREIGNLMGVCNCQLSLGDAAWSEGDTNGARERFTGALQLALNKQAEPLVGEAMLGIAQLAFDAGELDDAVRWLQPTVRCDALDQDAKARRETLMKELAAPNGEWGPTAVPLLDAARELQQRL